MQLPIHSTDYYLTSPGKFEAKKSTIDAVPKQHTILQTLYTAICGSDVQYYRGEKSDEKLRTRLPLILLHEGVCLDLKTGKRVVPIAGDFRNVPYEFSHKENTWPKLPYLGATMPGLARTHFLYPKDLLIQVPTTIPAIVLSIVEPLTVALKSVTDMGMKKNEKIAIIGTGGLAFSLALVLHFFVKIPKKHIFIFGINDAKLQTFKHIAQTVNYTRDPFVDHSFPKVFEAVGRSQMHTTLQTALRLIQPGGTIGVLGISESPWSLPIERLVNWQITIKGLTRSTPKEYPRTIRFLRKKEICEIIEKYLISTNIRVIQSAKDLTDAFDFVESSKALGRTVLKWI